MKNCIFRFRLRIGRCEFSVLLFSIGRNIQRLRTAKGWSQEELAFQAGLHRTYISGVERGVRNPTVTVLEKIAQALNITLAEAMAE